jgi:DNA-binding NarL/FixJ family response regulator
MTTATSDPTHTTTQTCLIVDDDHLIAERLRMLVAELRLDVCGVAHDSETAVETAINLQPDVVLMDVRLGGERDGVDAAFEILKRTRSRVIFVTAFNDDASVERMKRSNPSGILIKPVDPKALKLALLG